MLWYVSRNLVIHFLIAWWSTRSLFPKLDTEAYTCIYSGTRNEVSSQLTLRALILLTVFHPHVIPNHWDDHTLTRFHKKIVKWKKITLQSSASYNIIYYIKYMIYQGNYLYWIVYKYRCNPGSSIKVNTSMELPMVAFTYDVQSRLWVVTEYWYLSWLHINSEHTATTNHDWCLL